MLFDVHRASEGLQEPTPTWQEEIVVIDDLLDLIEREGGHDVIVSNYGTIVIYDDYIE